MEDKNVKIVGNSNGLLPVQTARKESNWLDYAGDDSAECELDADSCHRKFSPLKKIPSDESFEAKLFSYVLFHHDDSQLPTIDPNEPRAYTSCGVFIPRIGNVVLTLIRHYRESDYFCQKVQEIVDIYNNPDGNRGKSLKGTLIDIGLSHLRLPEYSFIQLDEFNCLMYYALASELYVEFAHSPEVKFIITQTSYDAAKVVFGYKRLDRLKAIEKYAEEFLADSILTYVSHDD